MRKISFVGFFAFMVCWCACQQETKNTEKTEPAPTDKRNIYTAADGKTVDIPVKLNGRSKWEANVETTNEIGAMVGMVNDLPTNPSIEDYQALQKKLAISFQTILQKCTMQGEAHKQLHNYLMPLKEKIDNLKDSDLTTSKTLSSEIKDYLMKYSHFFFT